MHDVVTRGQLRALITRAETLAEARRHHDPEVHELLTALATVARRRMDPEYAPEPDQYLGGEDLVSDPFGEDP